MSRSPRHAGLELTLLHRYLFFLSRRPISVANRHYLDQRLAGLRALAVQSREQGPSEASDVLDGVERLNVNCFARRAPELIAGLARLTGSERPKDVLTAVGSPSPDIWQGIESVDLIFGPAIGIGDELMASAFISGLRNRDPAFRIHVLSGYDGLEPAMVGADRVSGYRGYVELASALRGSFAGSALCERGAHARPERHATVLVDFETPGLVGAVLQDGPGCLHVEVGLGGCQAVVWDPRTRLLFERKADGPAKRFYRDVHETAAWLGLSPDARLASLDPRRPERAGATVIFVSPFTSKYEPRLEFWTRLLERVSFSPSSSSLRLVLDAGANASTARFAHSLLRELNRRGYPDARVCSDGADSRLSLAGAVAQARSADAILCTDSYLAHLGPIFGAQTFVVAPVGLEAWRVPSPRSYYLNEAQGAEGLGGAILTLLDAGTRAPRLNDGAPSALRRLMDHELALERALADEPDPAELLRAYNGFAAQYGRAVRHIVGAKPFTRELLSDVDYENLLAPLSVPTRPGWESDPAYASALRRHAQQCLSDGWRGSNLWKYLACARSERALQTERRPQRGLLECT